MKPLLWARGGVEVVDVDTTIEQRDGQQGGVACAVNHHDTAVMITRMMGDLKNGWYAKIYHRQTLQRSK